MDIVKLKKEQQKLSSRVVLSDSLHSIKTVGGAECLALGKDLLAVVVVCEFPSLKLLEKKTYLLPDAGGFKLGFRAYREMPAIVEAFNKLEQEPDLLLVKGNGILHPRKLGMASHLGLALNKPTIGVTQKLFWGDIEKGKIILDKEIVGFEFRTKEHANPIYISPGHLISLGSVLNIMPKLVIQPHKMPEPLHLARKIGKKEVKKAPGEI